MPPIRNQNSQNSVHQEDRIQIAIKAFQNGEIPTIREITRVFDIPRRTLDRRLQGIPFRRDTPANGHKLTPEEEQSLLQWILSMDMRGSAPRPPMVREMANILLRNSFQAAGLVPYDPERVTSKLDVQLHTPTPPGSRPSSRPSAWSPKTPANPKQLNRQASSIKIMTSRQFPSGRSPIQKQIDQLIKGSHFAMHNLAILRQQVYDICAENEKTKQKRQRSKRRIAQSGGFRDSEGREALNSPNQANAGQNPPPPVEADASASQPIRRAPHDAAIVIN